MSNVSVYGEPPYRVAVLHGGPGAPGQVAPVARELSRYLGVLEPLQTVSSLDGQVEELRGSLEERSGLPVTLIVHFWGAMLGFIIARRHPQHVRKLILVGSGVYEERYAARIQQTRLGRLSEEERQEVLSLQGELEDPAAMGKGGELSRLGELFTMADAYDPLSLETEVIEVQHQVNERVWREARQLRESGDLIQLGQHIRCPFESLCLLSLRTSSTRACCESRTAIHDRAGSSTVGSKAVPRPTD